jgi:hypothetical protein
VLRVELLSRVGSLHRLIALHTQFRLPAVAGLHRGRPGITVHARTSLLARRQPDRLNDLRDPPVLGNWR